MWLWPWSTRATRPRPKQRRPEPLRAGRRLVEAGGVDRLMEDHDAHRLGGLAQLAAQEADLVGVGRGVPVEDDHAHRALGERVAARRPEDVARGRPAEVVVAPRRPPGDPQGAQAALGTPVVRGGRGAVRAVEVVAGRQHEGDRGPARLDAHPARDRRLGRRAGPPVALHQEPHALGGRRGGDRGGGGAARGAWRRRSAARRITRPPRDPPTTRCRGAARRRAAGGAAGRRRARPADRRPARPRARSRAGREEGAPWPWADAPPATAPGAGAARWRCPPPLRPLRPPMPPTWSICASPSPRLGSAGHPNRRVGRCYTPAPAGARSPRNACVSQTSGGPGSPPTRS